MYVYMVLQLFRITLRAMLRRRFQEKGSEWRVGKRVAGYEYVYMRVYCCSMGWALDWAITIISF